MNNIFPKQQFAFPKYRLNVPVTFVNRCYLHQHSSMFTFMQGVIVGMRYFDRPWGVQHWSYDIVVEQGNYSKLYEDIEEDDVFSINSQFCFNDGKELAMHVVDVNLENETVEVLNTYKNEK